MNTKSAGYAHWTKAFSVTGPFWRDVPFYSYFVDEAAEAKLKARVERRLGEKLEAFEPFLQGSYHMTWVRKTRTHGELVLRFQRNPLNDDKRRTTPVTCLSEIPKTPLLFKWEALSVEQRTRAMDGKTRLGEGGFYIGPVPVQMSTDGPVAALPDQKKRVFVPTIYKAKIDACLERILSNEDLGRCLEGSAIALEHIDLHPRNILVDDEGKVIGVIDWDGARTVPLWAFNNIEGIGEHAMDIEERLKSAS
ncbi:hypothetical protein FISHEDRAFT_70827 [Fistulina hepatica ATCC 64428]|uniref:Aminoglycoside phosphotransferase domain-containing protein n=1 Tax=Fistulina hepatica ATCC 64428 TaxID=1128425 RepID=A0A0D7AK83_9AGAR|nr:hypothetical protein FISHEDRAFT_70827 [Fistulina hepatica ATCC 64428]